MSRDKINSCVVIGLIILFFAVLLTSCASKKSIVKTEESHVVEKRDTSVSVVDILNKETITENENIVYQEETFVPVFNKDSSKVIPVLVGRKKATVTKNTIAEKNDSVRVEQKDITILKDSVSVQKSVEKKTSRSNIWLLKILCGLSIIIAVIVLGKIKSSFMIK